MLDAEYQIIEDNKFGLGDVIGNMENNSDE
jgi:hypothetical protein